MLFAALDYAGQYIRLEIRFRGALCYVDAITEPHLLSRFLPGHGEILMGRKMVLQNLEFIRQNIYAYL